MAAGRTHPLSGRRLAQMTAARRLEETARRAIARHGADGTHAGRPVRSVYAWASPQLREREPTGRGWEGEPVALLAIVWVSAGIDEDDCLTWSAGWRQRLSDIRGFGASLLLAHDASVDVSIAAADAWCRQRAARGDTLIDDDIFGLAGVWAADPLRVDTDTLTAALARQAAGDVRLETQHPAGL